MASRRAPPTEATSTPTGPASSPTRGWYQLIRQEGPIGDRRFEIEFLDGGAQGFCFTFG